MFRPSHWRRVTTQEPQGPSALLTDFWVDHLVPAHRTASSVLRWKAKKFIKMEPEQIHTPAVALCGTPTSLTYHWVQIHSPCIGELYALETGFAMALYFQHLPRSLISLQASVKSIVILLLNTVYSCSKREPSITKHWYGFQPLLKHCCFVRVQSGAGGGGVLA